ncbi:hypothetical protein S7711_07594 [Stachybotrys chartarum IBT 7711]|uniref:Uncharacterized protein n=1 Tax=Stachybotrys chartarum (strain CBS 109288 / IBT 7711) TaxID=1280523 RepID=A0A084AQ05_STACB|nr:hypothetical protein S7711_07594 [Stachybotrys chartarum IBT 7711]KFA47076.1 hypothetical protein S40293_04601 [Stachybotrys chartarum IBT 40293]KFA75504.1 hypothetical protein S40288_01154 [Stachybotrys chartarum IBT 40288]
MFAKPRAKKSTLPPPNKKRKTTSNIEEINFDNDARQEYLTGFHKRKQQRIKHAQEEAAKKAREERLETRKQVSISSIQVREERKREVEEHVQTVNRMLRESGAIVPDLDQPSEEESAEDWEGFPDQPNLEIVDHEEEYIDEDRYTTVTVESVSVTRDGLNRPETLEEVAESTKVEDKAEDNEEKTKQSRPKKKKKKFRYESKIERQISNVRQKAKNKSRRPA